MEALTFGATFRPRSASWSAPLLACASGILPPKNLLTNIRPLLHAQKCTGIQKHGLRERGKRRNDWLHVGASNQVRFRPSSSMLARCKHTEVHNQVGSEKGTKDRQAMPSSGSTLGSFVCMYSHTEIPRQHFFAPHFLACHTTNNDAQTLGAQKLCLHSFKRGSSVTSLQPCPCRSPSSSTCNSLRSFQRSAREQLSPVDEVAQVCQQLAVVARLRKIRSARSMCGRRLMRLDCKP
eukprot:scaffold131763_cov19-Tisochrysis_lutea.AAC.1